MYQKQKTSVCLQIVDANILKQYIFQKGFITESAKLKREQEAASSTLQVQSTLNKPCPLNMSSMYCISQSCHVHAKNAKPQ